MVAPRAMGTGPSLFGGGAGACRPGRASIVGVSRGDAGAAPASSVASSSAGARLDVTSSPRPHDAPGPPGRLPHQEPELPPPEERPPPKLLDEREEEDEEDQLLDDDDEDERCSRAVVRVWLFLYEQCAQRSSIRSRPPLCSVARCRVVVLEVRVRLAHCGHLEWPENQLE